METQHVLPEAINPFVDFIQKGFISKSIEKDRYQPIYGLTTRNLILLSQANGEWLPPFTSEEYKKLLWTHQLIIDDDHDLDLLLEKAYLNYDGNIYSFSEGFFFFIEEWKWKK